MVGQSNAPLPWYWNMVCGSIAGCTAEFTTIPLDTAKVRLQTQGELKRTMGDDFIAKYKGPIQTLKTIYAEEGIPALWRGIFAGLQRQCVFAGIRIGLYPNVRDAICGSLKDGQAPTLWQRILAGLITGGIGISVASPTDVVKIRLQSDGNLPADKKKYNYKGSFDAYSKIIKNDGVVGLWTGLSPNIVRNSLINAAELASYDQIKTTALRLISISPDSKFLHIICGLSAGLIAVTIASPVDVVKTRLMNNPKFYGGVVGCFSKTFRSEGIQAFYNGFQFNFLRLGSWNTIMFLCLEQCQIYVRDNIRNKKN